MAILRGVLSNRIWQKIALCGVFGGFVCSLHLIACFVLRCLHHASYFAVTLIHRLANNGQSGLVRTRLSLSGNSHVDLPCYVLCYFHLVWPTRTPRAKYNDSQSICFCKTSIPSRRQIVKNIKGRIFKQRPNGLSPVTC